MTNREAKRIAAHLFKQAQENHELVLQLIDELEASGQIEKGELDYYRRVAQKWLKISEENQERGREQE